ncbi:unnamed protein product [Auanema sp. JU1783]|nr:unnamed protein product [Auanema sp. JU1783]
MVKWLLLLSSIHLTSSLLIEKAEQKTNADTLVFFQTVWRHGDRTPAVSLPFDNIDGWKEGLGEMTKIGLIQQYHLGKWMRMRYAEWLPEKYHRDEVYVRSSDYNRTIMSALANMAGFYPAADDAMIEPTVRWQPIPIHSKPQNIDKELNEVMLCPVADQATRDISKMKEMKDLEEKYKDLLHYLREHMNGTALPVEDVWKVYDVLTCQLQHNDTNPWPNWVNQTIYNQVVELYNKQSRYTFSTDVLRRLRGGPLLKEILDRFVEKTDGVFGKNMRLYAYSAHDTSIYAVLSALNIFPETFPLYATVLLFELHKVSDKYILEIYHKNQTGIDDVYKYSIDGCENGCSPQDFQRIYQSVLPQNWEIECGLGDPKRSEAMYIGTICFLAFTTVLFGSGLILDYILKKRRMIDRDLRERLMNEED